MCPFELTGMYEHISAIVCMRNMADIHESNRGAGIAHSDSCKRLTETGKHVLSGWKQ